jgi:hypothetical protein
MVWLGLGLGIIDILKADKLFFQLFENIFERAMASVCRPARADRVLQQLLSQK